MRRPTPRGNIQFLKILFKKRPDFFPYMVQEVSKKYVSMFFFFLPFLIAKFSKIGTTLSKY